MFVVEHPDKTDIYEHGIVSTEPVPGLLLLATTREPIYSGYSLAIVAADGSSLNHRAFLLADVPVAHWHKDFYQEYDMRYCLRASLYHLNRVIDLYVEKCRLLEQIHPDRPTEGNTNDSRIFFEVDAFLGAARRAYDAISNVIWKHLVGGPNRWDSAHDAVKWMKKHPGKVPTEVEQTYIESWDTSGAKLTDYRDYIMHHVPLTDGGETVWMNYFGGRWGATMALPKNPEAKSRARSNLTKDIDALSYCHGVATELMRLAEFVTAQPAVTSYIANPPRHSKDGTLRETE
jgi:hypothetical protein